MDNKQEELLNMKNIVTDKFTKEDINSFIEIHVENLFSKSEFSKIYLAERFNYLLQNKDVVTVSVKNSSGEMLGLVYGGPEGYKDQMNKYIMKKLIWSFCKKPYLLFGKEFIYKYKSSLKRFALKFRNRSTNYRKITNHLKSPYQPLDPILRLTGIAVLEKYLHLGIGEQLLAEYEIVAKEQNYKSIIAETPETNNRAIKFYEKFGWESYINENGNVGKVYYYKLIPENK